MAAAQDAPVAPPVTPATPGNCHAVVGYDWDVRTAYAICMAESGGDPIAHDYSDATKDDSYGLFQINLYGNLKYGRPAPNVLVTVKGNVEFAYRLYKLHGWSAWSTYKNGRYEAYL